MKQVKVKILRAFSINSSGGNPAGVVLNADDLSQEEKQRIAAQLELSEIAYVSNSKTADFKLDFFTPNKQIPHCGHATIATFSYLNQLGFINSDSSSKETIDGNRDIYFKDGLTFMEQTSPSYADVLADIQKILESLNLSSSDLLSGYSPSIVNTGNSFLIVPVVNKTVLQKISPDLKAISKYSAKRNLIGFYVFASAEEPVAASARMFAPYYGIDEEAATGMAAGPLACYLFKKNLISNTEIFIKQGEFMNSPSPSLIKVELMIDRGEVKRLFAGGAAFVADEKIIRI